MTYKVELSLAALNDLQAITDRLALVNPSAAMRLFQTIKNRCLALDILPDRGLSFDVDDPSFRDLFEGHFIIRYRVLAAQVQILRIVDGRRSPAGFWQDQS